MAHSFRGTQWGSAQPITVEDYAGVGPPDLWTLRAAILAVAAESH
ncbi:MAG TPA: hypothetical protein VGR31_12450 [Planctomycetota bacterium]|nr:hypothetical protein [Planctomycetota bacterium]